jgi:hypothetical protein
MEQSTMEQIMEFMKANKAHQEELMAKMDADNYKSKAHQEEMMAEMKVIQHKMDANRRERKAHHEEMRAEMDAWLAEVTPACLEEEKEPAPEEPKAMVETTGSPRGSDGRRGDRSS